MTKRSLAVALAAILTIPAVASADHIPGHHNYDPTWPVPIPGREFFNGGVLFVDAIGPLGGYEITNATFDITYVSDGATPASDIVIVAAIQTQSGYLETEVTGADLGFGSGPGTFKGTFATHALDGVVERGFLGPYSLMHLTIDSLQGGIQGEGYFVQSAIVLDVTGTIPSIQVTGDCPGSMTFTVSGAQPNQRIALLAARGEGSLEIPRGACAGQTLGLDSSARIAAVTSADGGGTAIFTANVASGACGRYWVQAIDSVSCLVTEVRPIQ
ncbi:MAG: hypothetical protein IT430_11465 [Phycisphaerales bacterium]|nr:hypothetical protein [Phycisphaerales bacterium]